MKPENRRNLIILAIMILLLIIVFCVWRPFEQLDKAIDEAKKAAGTGPTTASEITESVTTAELKKRLKAGTVDWTTVVDGEIWYCEICGEIYHDTTQKLWVFTKDKDKYGVRFYKKGYCSPLTKVKQGEGWFDIETGKPLKDNITYVTVCKNKSWAMKWASYFEMMGPRVAVKSGNEYVCINSPSTTIFSDVVNLSVPPEKEERYGVGGGSSLDYTKYPFIGDGYKAVYHKVSCPSVKNLEYRIFFCDENEAKNEFHYEPAPDCL